jgi:hypothetical protein
LKKNNKKQVVQAVASKLEILSANEGERQRERERERERENSIYSIYRRKKVKKMSLFSLETMEPEKKNGARVSLRYHREKILT